MENYLISDKPTTTKGWLFDGIIAAAAFLFGCAQLALTTSTVVFRDEAFRTMVGVATVTPDASAYLVLALTTLPLLLRRRFTWPTAVFVFFVCLSAQNAFRGFTISMVGPMVALFTVCSERGKNEGIAAAVFAGLLFLLVGAPIPNASLAFIVSLSNLAFLALAAVAGFAFKTYQGYVRQTEQRALLAEKTKEEEAARRVEEERVRIAREIHDITAHSLSAVNIQATVAEKMIDKNPAAACEAIGQVRSTSKQALDEIRAMIGVLRNEDAAETAPTSGTDRMGDLCDYLRNAGLEVTLDTAHYDARVIPAYVDVALFGIAREAATNVVRHASAQHVEMTLTHDASKQTAQVRVVDDGVGPSGQHDGGHGLRGMEERARVLGGTFEAGKVAPHGFSVCAVIPVVDRSGDE